MENQPKFIKEFSKEQSAEERQQTAEDIRTKRTEHFDRKDRLSEEIQELTTKAQEKEIGVAETVEKMKALETELEQRKDNRFLEFLNHFKLKKIREEIGLKTVTREAFEDEYQNIQDELVSLRQQSEDKKALKEAKDILNGFYGTQTKEWEVYNEDLKIRDVDGVMEEHDVVFVHGFRPNFVPGEHSLLRGDVGLEDKFNILFALEPTISTSTIQEGDSHEKMWSSTGVILNGGSIVSAHTSDAGTMAVSLKERTSRRDEPDSIKDDIKEAIESEAKNHNEFVVKDQEIAGFYIYLDEGEGFRAEEKIPPKQILRLTKGLGLQLYAIQDGIVYETEYNQEKDEFIKKDRVSVDDIRKKEFHIDESKKEKMVEDLFVDPPFKMEFAEHKYLDSRFSGKQAYIEINAHDNPDNFEGVEAEYKGEEVEYSKSQKDRTLLKMENGTPIKVIAELDYCGDWIKYFMKDGEVWRQKKERRGREYTGHVINDYSKMKLHQIDIIINGYRYEISNNKEYFSEMEDIIQKHAKLRDKYSEDIQLKGSYPYLEGEKENEEEQINILVYHLYGFGEEAGKFGDSETQKKAFELAEQFLKQDEYQEVLERRIDEDGMFKMTKEDLM